MWAKSWTQGHREVRLGTYCAGVVPRGVSGQRPPLAEHRVVVIARDRHIGTNLADDLEGAGFSVQGPTAGPDGIVAAVEQLRAGLAVAALVVDNDSTVVMDACKALAPLPGMEVLAVGDYPRAETVAQMLDAGVVDVMTAHCPPIEQHARIRRSLTRAAQEVSPLLSAGVFTIDVAARTVLREGESLRLTRTEFDLFLALARRPDRVVSAVELLRACLGYDHADPHVLTVHIQRLRAKVEPDPAHPRHITSVRGVGYCLRSD